jgi:MraZ protein
VGKSGENAHDPTPPALLLPPTTPVAGFKGQYENAIDEKGRVAIPAKMRRVLHPEAAETFTATRGFEKCVFLYPLDRWEEMEGEFMQLNPYQREARDFVRTITRWAEDVSLDKQGRIVLPKRLMEFAGLTSEAVIIGSLDRIEVWDPQAFEAYLNEAPGDYESIAERVMG